MSGEWQEKEFNDLKKERDLLYDALNLHMRATGITNAAMSRIDEYREIINNSEKKTRGELQRLESGWRAADDERKALRTELCALKTTCDELRMKLNANPGAIAAAEVKAELYKAFGQTGGVDAVYKMASDAIAHRTCDAELTADMWALITNVCGGAILGTQTPEWIAGFDRIRERFHALRSKS